MVQVQAPIHTPEPRQSENGIRRAKFLPEFSEESDDHWGSLALIFRAALFIVSLALLPMTTVVSLARLQPAQSPWLAYVAYDGQNSAVYRALADGSSPQSLRFGGNYAA